MTTEVRSPFCLNEASFTHAREGGDLQIVAIGLLSFDEKHRQLLEDQKKDDDRSSSASSFEFSDSVTDEAVISLIEEHNEKNKNHFEVFCGKQTYVYSQKYGFYCKPRAAHGEVHVEETGGCTTAPPSPRILHKTTATIVKCYQHPTLFTIFSNLHYIAYLRVFLMTLSQMCSYVSTLVTVMCLAAWKINKSRIFFSKRSILGIASEQK